MHAVAGKWDRGFNVLRVEVYGMQVREYGIEDM
jgi:hypothetical protein